MFPSRYMRERKQPVPDTAFGRRPARGTRWLIAPNSNDKSLTKCAGAVGYCWAIIGGTIACTRP
jgi:hypothetical protein